MTKRTKTTLFIATIYFLVLVVIFVYALYFVRAQGSALDRARVETAEATAKNAAYNSIVRITESSESDREELQRYFFTEKDTIGFIAELEAAAARVGVTFETTELSTPEPVIKSGQPANRTLVMGCRFVGSEESVKRFLTILENIPYHAEIPTMTISNQALDNKWVGDGKLVLTLKP